jgi:hypothetical protein
LFKCGHRITLSAEVVKDNKTELGTAVGRVEVDEVNDADGLSLFIINHHPHLTVGVDIIGDMGYIIVEHVTGIGHVRSSDVPEADVVLDAVEQVEIFGFDGS